MPKYGDEILTTPVKEERPPGGDGGLTLNVIGEAVSASHRLPERGEASIGRSQHSDIAIDDPSISRRHALLRIGTSITIEDLGSSNGTRAGGRTLQQGERQTIVVGEAVEVGAVTLVLAASSRRPGLRPRRLLSHDYFEARLEDECARATRLPSTFSVVRLSASGAPSEGVLQEALADAIGPEHPVGTYGPGEYEALLVNAAADEATRLIATLTERLRGRGVELKSGLASYPRDGRTPEALVAQACRLLRGPARAEVTTLPMGPAIVVVDAAMERLHRLAERVAAGNISVLLLGETGSGKEILAETIHVHSPRKQKPFLRLNCAALAESLLESELFGHEKGSFSGAVAAKPGLLETADGGTVFLDEVGEMPLSLQAKLLRVLEERKVMRVGGLKAKPIDVRFVSATNRDLEAEAARGHFRLDLYYRLSGIALMIPPLRERPSEIAALAEMFLGRAAAEVKRPAPRLTPEALALLQKYIWPGNIRELRNMMERAVLLCGDGEVTLEHLPVEKMSAGFTGAAPPPMPLPEPRRPSPTAASSPTLPPLPPVSIDPSTTLPLGTRGPVAAAPPSVFESTEELPEGDERQRIIAALERCAGNQTHAARLLGISRGTLVSRLAEYNLPRPRKR